MLVFGESQNDTAAIKELVLALKPACPNIQIRRQPMVLMKGRPPAAVKKSAQKIAQVVRAEQIKSLVVAVVAHEDCDAVEPEHCKVSNDIEKNLIAEGVPSPIAAAPAWEIEAWWYLWPDAVAAVCSAWKPLARRGNSVGHIANAKEALRNDLRPAGKGNKAPDYEERHSVKIAENVRKMNLIKKLSAKSASFDLFAEMVTTKI